MSPRIVAGSSSRASGLLWSEGHRPWCSLPFRAPSQGVSTSLPRTWPAWLTRWASAARSSGYVPATVVVKSPRAASSANPARSPVDQSFGVPALKVTPSSPGGRVRDSDDPVGSSTQHDGVGERTLTGHVKHRVDLPGRCTNLVDEALTVKHRDGAQRPNIILIVFARGADDRRAAGNSQLNGDGPHRPAGPVDDYGFSSSYSQQVQAAFGGLAQRWAAWPHWRTTARSVCERTGWPGHIRRTTQPGDRPNRPQARLPQHPSHVLRPRRRRRQRRRLGLPAKQSGRWPALRRIESRSPPG
jgi:hypothetical protein